MNGYPRTARDAAVKCVGCNAPVVVTVDSRYGCVERGESPNQQRSVRAIHRDIDSELNSSGSVPGLIEAPVQGAVNLE